MSNSALFAAFLLNMLIAFGYFKDSNPGMVLTFASYAQACLGFIWANGLK